MRLQGKMGGVQGNILWYGKNQGEAPPVRPETGGLGAGHVRKTRLWRTVPTRVYGTSSCYAPSLSISGSA